MLAFHAPATTIYHAARELRYVVARTHTHVFGSKQLTYGFALMREATDVDSTVCTCITKAYAVRGSHSSSSLTARASGEAPPRPRNPFITVLTVRTSILKLFLCLALRSTAAAIVSYAPTPTMNIAKLRVELCAYSLELLAPFQRADCVVLLLQPFANFRCRHTWVDQTFAPPVSQQGNQLSSARGVLPLAIGLETSRFTGSR